MRVVVLADTVAYGWVAGVACLDLESRMPDLETFTELLLKSSDQVLAIRGVEVLGDDDMTAEGQLLGVERPDMQVMDRSDSVRLENRGPDLSEVQTTRSALE